MIAWQFWTIIGTLGVLGIYLISSLSALIDAVNKTNSWLGMNHEHLRRLVGIGASTSIDIEAIKQRLQRD